jgi:non-heme chloroperoxidase
MTPFTQENFPMPTITTADGTEIFYKDWGAGQPIVFSHGWPLSADDWDPQMLFFQGQGFRVIAHDRRGHGRSSQTGDGHDMDHYAADLAALTAHLDLKKAVHVGHSTGGGEVAAYLGRHGESRVAKAVLISAVPPIMVKTPNNPGGLPRRCSTTCRRSLPPTARNSIAICRRGRSTATTGRGPSHRKPSSRTGGAKA